MPQRAVENESGQYIGFALCLLGLIGGAPILVLPLMLVGKFCPETAFAHGSMSSFFLYPSGFIISALCYFCLAGGIMPKTDGKPRFKYEIMNKLSDNHWGLFLTSAICGLGLGAAILFDVANSYYCLTPNDIFLHPSAFAEARSLPWSDVTAVQAKCGHNKGGLFGGLVISFRGGQKIWTSLGGGEGQNTLEYMAIRKALKDQSYSYTADFSVTQTGCPSDIYLWFAGRLSLQE